MNSCVARRYMWRLTGDESRETGILVHTEFLASATRSAGGLRGLGLRRRMQNYCANLHDISFKMRCRDKRDGDEKYCFSVNGNRRTFRSVCQGVKRYPWLHKSMALINKHARKGKCKPKPAPCPFNYDPVCARREYGNRCLARAGEGKSGTLYEGRCPSTSDDSTGRTLSLRLLQSQVACPMIYEPVCWM